MKVKDAWKLSFLLLVSCSSLQWGWKYSDSGSSFSPNPWKAQSVRRLVLKPTLLRGRKKNNPLLFSFGLFRILFGWHLFSFSVKPGRIDFSFPCPFSDWKWVRPSCNHKIPDAGPYMATEFPKCGRHYLLKLHFTVTGLKRSYQKSASLLKWSVCGCGCCPAHGALRPNLVGKLHCAMLLVNSSMDAAPGGRGSVLCELRAMVSSQSALFLPPCCRSLAGPAVTACALQVMMSSDAPVKTVRSNRLWLCGFLLDVPLRGRHSGHFASF